MKFFVKSKKGLSVPNLTPENVYEVLSVIETDLCKSGECIVITNNRGEIMGYDSGHFE